MSDQFCERLRVYNLPSYYARQCTEDDNEIAFRFESVACTIDESDGSFTIRAMDAERWQWAMRSQDIVKTGTRDRNGKYTFSEKSQWAKHHTDDRERSNADEYYYAAASYFRNDLGGTLNQRKLRVQI